MVAAIETRRDLARYLQTQMLASRGRWGTAADEEDVGARTMVKTYLVEAHCSHDDEATALALTALGGSVGFHIVRAAEPGLFQLVAPGVEFWCDTSMGRFWRMHTTAPVKDADPLQDRMVSSAPWLDKVWLPPDYLENLPAKTGARMLTFSLNHDRRPLSKGDEPTTDADSVTLRLWASHAQETLRKLRNAAVFPHGVSIRSVRLRSGATEPDGAYCVAEYFYDGKVTVGGTSFDEHTRLIVGVLRDYGALVESLEKHYAIGTVQDHHGHPTVIGDPVVVEVDWTLPDLEFAVARIFGSAEPFRLWGLPERLADGHYRARAVDLHVGGVLTFDITRKYVAIQLPRGVCGNTVVRFINHLRFHVNADAVRV